MAAIRLIVGLGNPGQRYAGTPHNVGADFVERLAQRFKISLAEDARFKGRIGRGNLANHDVRLLIPSTFMNLSGECVGAVATFYKFSPAEILVAHDEMAFEPGTVRLKLGGGHNGHNGLRDIIGALGNDASFVRLRIGVGHPGDRDRVSGFLTGTRMHPEARARVEQATDLPDALLALLCAGDFPKVMNELHSAADGAE
jgi:PTH1 family peptidyl-tRNA hydrolase